jgi:superfamily II DNA or RNA helicase
LVDERRRFNAAERAALYLAADGRCTECGAELEPEWHADHVDPYSRGGPTDVVNGQALCPPCNLKKGAQVTGLRKWQSNALREFSAWQPEGQNGFLVEATPGAGKTRFSIEVARRLLEAGRIEQIVVAVPTSRLENQWAEDFAPFGINVSPTWHAADGRLPADEHGCAATYGEIQFSPQSFRRLVSRRPTLVILDEVHHCGDQRSWGEAIRLAFVPAAVKLLLSGTPFRSDNNEIPFVRYVDNVGAPDFRYGYDQALADRVVRAVFFPRRGGQMEWDDPEGRRRQHTFADVLDERDARHRLRTALLPSGDWLPSVIADADRQLGQLRESDPSAGGIVFCEDTGAARAVYELLTRLGRTPVLAITEESESDARIKAFRDSRDLWIVSIRKVSEGVDLPRLRVGVYATPWVTELFFRQVVGRLVRTKPEEDDPSSWLYIPDDERLRSMAATIKEQRDHVLGQQQAELLGGGTAPPPPTRFIPIGANEATDEGTIVGDANVTPTDLAEAERIKSLSPETTGLPTPLLAVFLRNAGLAGTGGALFDMATAVQPTTLHDRKQQLKQANNTTAKRIAAAYGVEHPIVNANLNRLVGVRKMAQASEGELEKRLNFAEQWLATGEPPRIES